LDTKEVVKIDELADYCEQTLAEIQSWLLAKNKAFREANTVSVDTRDDFVLALDAGKFVMAHRDGTTETEVLIKEETKATIRCIPIPPAPLPKGGADQAGGLCIRTGKPSKGRVLFARAY
jgi:prolyl-tRNA synthetase